MTTAAHPETSREQAAPKVGMAAVLIPVLLSTAITLGVVGGGAFWLVKHGALAGAPAAPPQQITVVEAPPPSHVVAMEPMIVNLADAGGRSYLRATVNLRIKDAVVKEGAKKDEAKPDPKAVDPAITSLRDTTIGVLSSKSSDDLLAPNGREELKKTLEHEYRERNPDAQVLAVYFTDFLVQRG